MDKSTNDGKDRVEKFSVTELANLRTELMQSGLDNWQAAEVLSTFLAGRGYGVDTRIIRDAVVRLEQSNCSIECMQAEIERVALVM